MALQGDNLSTLPRRSECGDDRHRHSACWSWGLRWAPGLGCPSPSSGTVSQHPCPPQKQEEKLLSLQHPHKTHRCTRVCTYIHTCVCTDTPHIHRHDHTHAHILHAHTCTLTIALAPWLQGSAPSAALRPQHQEPRAPAATQGQLREAGATRWREERRTHGSVRSGMLREFPQMLERENNFLLVAERLATVQPSRWPATASPDTPEGGRGSSASGH